MANFETAFNITLSHEGGYVNDPLDKGGETYMGIARKYHPGWRGWKTIDRIKWGQSIEKGEVISDASLHNDVKMFYKKKFWDVSLLDEVYSQKIANEIFDTSVNMGIGTAVKFVQETINLLNRNQKSYRDIIVDGQLGPVTLNFINSSNEKAFMKCLNGLQFMKYYEICKRDESQEIFMLGWLNRI